MYLPDTMTLSMFLSTVTLESPISVILTDKSLYSVNDASMVRGFVFVIVMVEMWTVSCTTTVLCTVFEILSLGSVT